MKQFLITLLLLAPVWATFAQSPTQIGIYSEGSWFFPKHDRSTFQSATESLSTGVGMYVSSPIKGRFSASLGLGYRYKTNQASFLERTDEGSIDYGGEGGGYGYSTVEQKFPQHYFTIPLKLRYTNSRHLFLESGLEAGWLLNYSRINEKPEYNWLLGIGYSKYRLQGSLSYVQGLKDQGMGKIQNEKLYGQIYRNRMIVLNLSYTLWGHTKQ
ncbi:hypothetical protein [Sunxiuqinia rutila]|uniref:hypothetical protein n=1 Tax=Sunxiuqinia rutila TaxID=1397841 RepID=UPI003D35BB6A